jgi:hypothetical protein
MSAKASGRVWDLDLPHNKRLVLLAMADHADHEGRNIYPSTDLIAWKTGYSFRQVQRVIDTLIADGILVVVKPARQQKPATYALDFKAGVAKPPFDPVARRAQGRQNVTPQGRQNVMPEQSRDDISDRPGMTFEPSRDDIAMSSKPWNHDHEPPTPSMPSLLGDGDGDNFYRELRRRKVGQTKARQIASMQCDPARILTLIDNRPNANDPNSLGRLINDIIDGVASDYVPPRAAPKGEPLQATRPNVPDNAVSPAEVARRMRESR